MAGLVLWLSLGSIQGCNPGNVSGSTSIPASAATPDESARERLMDDGWEPGPVKAWEKCKAIRLEEALGQGHEGVNGAERANFEFFRSRWISKEGASIVGVRIQQGALVGEIVSSGGEKTLVQGEAWRGVQLRGRLRCPAIRPQPLKLNVQARISAVVPEGAGPAGGEWRYRVEILWPPVASSAQAWTSEYTPGYAIALNGVWDDATGAHGPSDDVATLAVDDTDVAKCYRQWRYRPWESGDPARPKPMSELHDACVRMVRADYCGDGKSATVDGTIVDVWDTANVNTKAPGRPGHGFEAAWTSKGAVCVDHLRWPALGRQCTSPLPTCHSPEEAKAIANQKGLGEVLLYNASCTGHPCADDPVDDPFERWR